MAQDILSEVIEVEKEIQKCLELETVKSREWLKKARKESEEEYLREEHRIKESSAQSLEAANKNAEVKAAEIIHQASLKAERLKKLNTETLREIIKKHISAILPG